jgi:hypothetical protein
MRGLALAAFLFFGLFVVVVVVVVVVVDVIVSESPAFCVPFFTPFP